MYRSSWFIPGAVVALRPGGLLAVEVGDGQAGRVVDLVDETAEYGEASVHKDLAGKDRIVAASKRA
jgi:methylase of polypeptide subunit release factors